jgi:hypothetical protein
MLCPEPFGNWSVRLALLIFAAGTLRAENPEKRDTFIPHLRGNDILQSGSDGHGVQM